MDNSTLENPIVCKNAKSNDRPVLKDRTERQRAQYAERKAAGICVKCGVVKARKGRSMCAKCANKTANYMQELRVTYFNTGRCLSRGRKLTDAVMSDGEYMVTCRRCRHANSENKKTNKELTTTTKQS